MPTKRTRRSRNRREGVTMDSLPLECLLDMAAGWHPPRSEFEASRSYWSTWGEFLVTWAAVRDEYLAREDLGKGDPPFAERVYRLYGAKGPPAAATYDELHAALDAADDATAAALLDGVDLRCA